MKIIIQKFGGTSLQNSELRQKAAELVKLSVSEGWSPVVVVSAIGRKGDPYATESLLDFVIRETPAIRKREKDMLLSCGEVISAVTFTSVLQHSGLEAVALTGIDAGIITDENHGNAQVKKVDTAFLHAILKSHKIPVVCGFQGISEKGAITTLGRGGSDTTASVLAAALDAEEIRVYKDVDGLNTADPKLICHSSLIPTASYEEAVELAEKGAQIIHPRAVEIAAAENIPIRIFSMKTGKSGTSVKNIKSDKPVTGITSKENIVLICLEAKTEVSNVQLKIFQLLADNNVSADFIDIRPDSISFIIDSENLATTHAIMQKNNFSCSTRENLVKVSIVGSGMTGVPGIMAKVVEALTSHQIIIFGCTDSRTTISCLIDKNDKIKAIGALHNIFNLDAK
ncbi:MAG TPA: aspartate kinase [Candidatus Cloacimonadota bacterium]|nr:aspartate kinase [Candidatus Cloacimonadota bacterium]